MAPSVLPGSLASRDHMPPALGGILTKTIIVTATMKPILSANLLLRQARVILPPLRSFQSSQSSGTDDRPLVFSQLIHPGVYELCLNRPDRKNALGKEFTKQLDNQIQYLTHETSRSFTRVRVVIVRSLVRGIFCAGADLKERLAMSEEQVPLMSASYRRLFTQLEELPVPTIAALDGHALGGGLELALACDLRIASANVKMGLVETGLAIIPGAGGTQRLPRVIGIPKAKQMILTSQIVDGSQALALGLVNECVKQVEGEDAAFARSLEIAKRISANGPIAVRVAKEAICKGMQVGSMEEALEIEGMCYEKIVPTKDRLEGLNAFVQKRKPEYKGE